MVHRYHDLLMSPLHGACLAVGSLSLKQKQV